MMNRKAIAREVARRLMPPAVRPKPDRRTTHRLTGQEMVMAAMHRLTQELYDLQLEPLIGVRTRPEHWSSKDLFVGFDHQPADRFMLLEDFTDYYLRAAVHTLAELVRSYSPRAFVEKELANRAVDVAAICHDPEAQMSLGLVIQYDITRMLHIAHLEVQIVP